ncbi:hypothetical protein NQ314_007028 [Rhamnusium bicolor]|uniref:Uncharacterized protein n=1 Tax=Rhamnusium bicolor TaxID=1586634 RepID=A0AAV8YUV2_9CUCU|nr:hypothetical protein NQ314_007028 [Rhamnusium bicolor]
MNTDFLDEIQYWMKHYDEEIERRESEMITLQNEYEKLIEDHNILKVKYEAHKAEMEDWLEYKRIRREKEEREALELWAAIKIQVGK